MILMGNSQEDEDFCLRIFGRFFLSIFLTVGVFFWNLSGSTYGEKGDGAQSTKKVPTHSQQKPYVDSERNHKNANLLIKSAWT